MSVEHDQDQAFDILAAVPSVAETRISSTINHLRGQRDFANNTVVNISAELEVYKKATDFYHQASLGLQAQLLAVKAAFEEQVKENEQLKLDIGSQQDRLTKAEEYFNGLSQRIDHTKHLIKSFPSVKDVRANLGRAFSDLEVEVIAGRRTFLKADVGESMPGTAILD
jgi:regulator of replication initiation timing